MATRVLTLPIGLLLGFVLDAGAASAQCRLCATPPTTAEPDDTAPVRIEVETNLDFDRLVLGGEGTGSASLSPDGTRRTSGGVLSIGGRAMVGTVTVRGEPGRSVRIGLPRTITLIGPSGSLQIDAIRSDLPSLPRIGTNGSLSFRFGGELHVSGTADGAFRGDFSVDVDYL